MTDLQRRSYDMDVPGIPLPLREQRRRKEAQQQRQAQRQSPAYIHVPLHGPMTAVGG